MEAAQETEALEACDALVHRLAGKVMRGRKSRGIFDRDDLEQEGRIGALHALRSFDPRAGCALSTWLGRGIYQHIVDAVRRVTRRRYLAGELVGGNGSHITELLSIDHPDWHEPAAQGSPFESAAIAAADTGRLSKCLFGIEREVIRGRFLEEKTLAEIARETGRHQSGIAQIEKQALARMRRAA